MSTVGGTISPSVAALTQGGIIVMTKTKFALAAALAFGISIAGAGARVLSTGQVNEQSFASAPGNSQELAGVRPQEARRGRIYRGLPARS